MNLSSYLPTKHAGMYEMLGILSLTSENPQTKKANFLTNSLTKIRLWNRADVLLYDYFNKTFWNQIKKLGSAFKADVVSKILQ